MKRLRSLLAVTASSLSKTTADNLRYAATLSVPGLSTLSTNRIFLSLVAFQAPLLRDTYKPSIKPPFLSRKAARMEIAASLLFSFSETTTICSQNGLSCSSGRPCLGIFTPQNAMGITQIASVFHIYSHTAKLGRHSSQHILVICRRRFPFPLGARCLRHRKAPQKGHPPNRLYS